MRLEAATEGHKRHRTFASVSIVVRGGGQTDRLVPRCHFRRRRGRLLLFLVVLKVDQSGNNGGGGGQRGRSGR